MGKRIPPDRPATGLRIRRAFLAVAAAAFLQIPARPQAEPQTAREAHLPEAGLLKFLEIEPSAESIDFVLNKTQFQLHTLLTEQRHPKTWTLGEKIRTDTSAGLHMLLSVDDDVAARLETLAADPAPLEQAVEAVVRAVKTGKKIYIYGCGATGRLAKQMESSFWQPFWTRIRNRETIRKNYPAAVPDNIENRLIGEMTGADRALISSLEGFEDLQLIGKLQLEDRGVEKGDVVICVTEGGETSSVIGTILAALEQWEKDPDYDPERSRKNLYFVYNNPDDRLLPFARSRKVIEEPGITKINLTTGPQAITGSTRMQATTIETYVVGTLLQAAAHRILAEALPAGELARAGFENGFDIPRELRGFARILENAKASVPALARLTDIEAETYRAGRFTTVFAEEGIITVFIDSTERSPTFRLHPLDTVKEAERQCWIQVWTAASDHSAAWLSLLRRPFRGLDPKFYGPSFESGIDDPYLRKSALESLKKAGNDQADLYDFSFSDFNLNRRGPHKGDLGIVVYLDGEERSLLRKDAAGHRFLDLFAGAGARTALVLVTRRPEKAFAGILRDVSKKGCIPLQPVFITVDPANDPFRLKQHIAAKILLNAHSTAVMAKLGKVVGNTMVNVSPSNLKLVGRATFLVQSHVNDVLRRTEWLRLCGTSKPITYGEANAVLYDSSFFLRDKKSEPGQPSAEVAFSIVRILESLKRKRALDREEIFGIVRATDLGTYLANLTAAN